MISGMPYHSFQRHNFTALLESVNQEVGAHSSYTVYTKPFQSHDMNLSHTLNDTIQ